MPSFYLLSSSLVICEQQFERQEKLYHVFGKDSVVFTFLSWTVILSLQVKKDIMIVFQDTCACFVCASLS